LASEKLVGADTKVECVLVAISSLSWTAAE